MILYSVEGIGAISCFDENHTKPIEMVGKDIYGDNDLGNHIRY